MQQVKELFNDCADVFEELIAVKTHLAEKIEECHSAVENIQSTLSEADASQSNVEAQLQVRGSQGPFPWHQFTKRTSHFHIILTRICVRSWKPRRRRQRLR